ncbi:MAG: helix-turn-helix transcriptional regulator [Bacteroidetes bacterium]|nr:helix-turn-helix transcriptional regulator [Bacteroidota bacterium]
MLILADPIKREDEGVQLSVPATLTKQVAKWATVYFRQYHFGYILTQELNTKLFNIYIYRFIIENNIVLFPFSEIPTLVLQFMLMGSIPCLLKGFGKITLRESRYNMFYIPNGANEALFEKGEYESFHIELHSPYINELSLTHVDIKDLMHKLNDSSHSGHPLRPGLITREIRDVVRDIRGQNKEGNALNLALTSDIYKLLSIYEDYLTGSDNRNHIILPGTEKTLSEIKEYIAADPDIHECSVENLSKKFNINANTLKINFKNEFNITLHQFVLDQVMQKARLMVLDNRYSISSIAIQLGYFDQSNFGKAFKNYFGLLPSEMRKRQE